MKWMFTEEDRRNELRALPCFAHLFPIRSWKHLPAKGDPADWLGVMPDGRTVAVEVKTRSNWWIGAPFYEVSANKIERLHGRADVSYLMILTPSGPCCMIRLHKDADFELVMGGRKPRPGIKSDRCLMAKIPRHLHRPLPRPEKEPEKKVEKEVDLRGEP